MSKMGLLTTVVQGIKMETPDTATITLELGGVEFNFKAGQAINIDPYQFDVLREGLSRLKQAKGEDESPRDFSISSSPLEKGFIQITVKEEKETDHKPVLSPYLVRGLKLADKIQINGPFGIYTLPANLEGITTIIHICAGSGIAPNRGIIKYCNDVKSGIRHVLFYQVRSEEDIIYREEVPTWQNLTFIPVLSRPSSSWTGGTGYVTKEHLASGFISPSGTLAFICGPSRPRPNHETSFIQKYKNILLELGLTAKNIKTELW